MPRDDEDHFPDTAALRRLQRMETAGHLAGSLAHEFNNLLQGVGGSLQLLRRRAAQGRPDDVERLAAAAMVALERAAALTRRMHDYARGEPGTPTLVDVNAVATEAAALARLVVGRAVRVQTELQSGLRPILCDAGRLESLLMGLCLNAREAMPQGGHLVISTAAAAFGEAGHVVLRMTDNGDGMTAAAVARARDSWRGGAFAAAGPPGATALLRLSALQGFATEAGGRAGIESTPGVGTTVSLWLPCHCVAVGGERSG